jgi:hypothetical protein
VALVTATGMAGQITMKIITLAMKFMVKLTTKMKMQSV